MMTIASSLFQKKKSKVKGLRVPNFESLVDLNHEKDVVNTYKYVEERDYGWITRAQHNMTLRRVGG